MTKKHFEALAQALANTRPDRSNYDSGSYPDAHNQWARDVQAIAQVCMEHNDRFDFRQFMWAAFKTSV